ncbi:MAG: nitroreductase family protein [Verrucomicrobia bacterium]|nr:nitroreductase family protein [Verrucomicrobiota bacterium]
MNAATALDAWNVSAADFPHTGASWEKLRFLLRYAVLAPSRHNSQPWLFKLRGSEVELYADRTRAARVSDPEDRELIISCGAALCHLMISMQHFAYLGSVEILPDSGDSGLLARVRLGLKGEHSSEENLTFHAILKRRSNRQAFSDDPVPEDLLEALQSGAEQEGAWFHVLRSAAARYTLADIIAEADRIQWADRRFRLELAAWLRPVQSGSVDGIPAYAHGMSDVLSCTGPVIVRTFNVGEGQAAKDRDIAAHSPVLAVLGTDADTLRDWLAAGQALARVLLRARAAEVWASFLNQPIELPHMRQRLPHVIGRPGFPQLILRLGFGTDVKPTPRRPVEEVLI